MAGAKNPNLQSNFVKALTHQVEWPDSYRAQTLNATFDLHHNFWQVLLMS